MDQVIKTSLNSLQEILECLVSSNKEMEQRIQELEKKVKTLEPVSVPEPEPEPEPEPVPVSKRVSELNKKVEDLEKEANEKANKKAIVLEEKEEPDEDEECMYNSGGEQPAPNMPTASSDANVFDLEDGNKYIYVEDGNNLFYKINDDETREEDPSGQILNFGEDEEEITMIN